MPTYSFTDVVGSISGPTGGTPIGYGEAIADEGISIEPTGDKNTMSIAADGTPMHSLHADASGTVVVRTQKTSPLNSALQLMYDAQTVSSSLHGNNTINVSHLPSGDTHQCTLCAFAKKPRIVYGKIADVMEWTFHAGTIHSVLGTY